jgi:hypothetical protein
MSESNYPQRKKPDNSGTTTHARDVNAAVRVQTAIKLRAQGLEWDEVAAQAGYGSKGAAHHAVHRELSRNISTNVEEMRREEALILTQLHKRCMTAAMSETNKGFLFAVDRVLGIRERYARLFGLDAKNDDIMAGVTVVREYGVEVTRV